VLVTSKDDDRIWQLAVHREPWVGKDNSFTGMSFARWLVARKRCSTMEEAQELGELLRRRDILHHVRDASHFVADDSQRFVLRADDPYRPEQSVFSSFGPVQVPPSFHVARARAYVMAAYFASRGDMITRHRFLVLDRTNFVLHVYDSDTAGRSRRSIRLDRHDVFVTTASAERRARERKRASAEAPSSPARPSADGVVTAGEGFLLYVPSASEAGPDLRKEYGADLLGEEDLGKGGESDTDTDVDESDDEAAATTPSGPGKKTAFPPNASDLEVEDGSGGTGSTPTAARGGQLTRSTSAMSDSVTDPSKDLSIVVIVRGRTVYRKEYVASSMKQKHVWLRALRDACDGKPVSVPRLSHYQLSLHGYGLDIGQYNPKVKAEVRPSGALQRMWSFMSPALGPTRGVDSPASVKGGERSSSRRSVGPAPPSSLSGSLPRQVAASPFLSPLSNELSRRDSFILPPKSLEEMAMSSKDSVRSGFSSQRRSMGPLPRGALTDRPTESLLSGGASIPELVLAPNHRERPPPFIRSRTAHVSSNIPPPPTTSDISVSTRVERAGSVTSRASSRRRGRDGPDDDQVSVALSVDDQGTAQSIHSFVLEEHFGERPRQPSLIGPLFPFPSSEEDTRVSSPPRMRIPKVYPSSVVTSEGGGDGGWPPPVDLKDWLKPLGLFGLYAHGFSSLVAMAGTWTPVYLCSPGFLDAAGVIVPEHREALHRNRPTLAGGTDSLPSANEVLMHMFGWHPSASEGTLTDIPQMRVLDSLEVSVSMPAIVAEQFSHSADLSHRHSRGSISPRDRIPSCVSAGTGSTAAEQDDPQDADQPLASGAPRMSLEVPEGGLSRLGISPPRVKLLVHTLPSAGELLFPRASTPPLRLPLVAQSMNSLPAAKQEAIKRFGERLLGRRRALALVHIARGVGQLASTAAIEARAEAGAHLLVPRRPRGAEMTLRQEALADLEAGNRSSAVLLAWKSSGAKRHISNTLAKRQRAESSVVPSPPHRPSPASSLTSSIALDDDFEELARAEQLNDWDAVAASTPTTRNRASSQVASPKRSPVKGGGSKGRTGSFSHSFSTPSSVFMAHDEAERYRTQSPESDGSSQGSSNSSLGHLSYARSRSSSVQKSELDAIGLDTDLFAHPRLGSMSFSPAPEEPEDSSPSEGRGATAADDTIDLSRAGPRSILSGHSVLSSSERETTMSLTSPKVPAASKALSRQVPWSTLKACLLVGIRAVAAELVVPPAALSASAQSIASVATFTSQQCKTMSRILLENQEEIASSWARFLTAAQAFFPAPSDPAAHSRCGEVRFPVETARQVMETMSCEPGRASQARSFARHHYATGHLRAELCEAMVVLAAGGCASSMVALREQAGALRLDEEFNRTPGAHAHITHASSYWASCSQQVPFVVLSCLFAAQTSMLLEFGEHPLCRLVHLAAAELLAVYGPLGAPLLLLSRPERPALAKQVMDDVYGSADRLATLVADLPGAWAREMMDWSASHAVVPSPPFCRLAMGTVSSRQHRRVRASLRGERSLPPSGSDWDIQRFWEFEPTLEPTPEGGVGECAPSSGSPAPPLSNSSPWVRERREWLRIATMRTQAATSFSISLPGMSLDTPHYEASANRFAPLRKLSSELVSTVVASPLFMELASRVAGRITRAVLLERLAPHVRRVYQSLFEPRDTRIREIASDTSFVLRVIRTSRFVEHVLDREVAFPPQSLQAAHASLNEGARMLAGWCNHPNWTCLSLSQRFEGLVEVKEALLRGFGRFLWWIGECPEAEPETLVVEAVDEAARSRQVHWANAFGRQGAEGLLMVLQAGIALAAAQGASVHAEVFSLEELVSAGGTAVRGQGMFLSVCLQDALGMVAE
jgi:hypothetical protein